MWHNRTVPLTWPTTGSRRKLSGRWGRLRLHLGWFMKITFYEVWVKLWNILGTLSGIILSIIMDSKYLRNMTWPNHHSHATSSKHSYESCHHTFHPFGLDWKFELWSHQYWVLAYLLFQSLHSFDLSIVWAISSVEYHDRSQYPRWNNNLKFWQEPKL